MSNSLSLLDELKDMAKEAAEREKTQATNALIDDQPTPASSSKSSSHASSLDALADLHKLIDEEARAEQTLRSKTRELAAAAKEAEQRAVEEQRQAEMQARLDAEESRRQSLAEDRRLTKLREDYEAALARGEHVEMPLELRPPELSVRPQDLDIADGLDIARQQAQVQAQEAVQDNQRNFIIGSVAAFVTIAAAIYVFVLSEPQPAPKVEKQVEMISFEQKQAEIEERKRIEKERREKEALAKIAEAKAAAERKAAEQAKAKKKRRTAKRKTQRKKKKKNSFGVSLDGF